jgi:hypothetical protein
LVPGGDAGGIFQLLGLIEEHPVAVARDFGEKFGRQVSELGLTLEWGTAVLWVRSLMADPTSWLQAALAGWAHPTSWEALASYDLFDLWADASSKHPRPWDKAKRSRLTAGEARAILKK